MEEEGGSGLLLACLLAYLICQKEDSVRYIRSASLEVHTHIKRALHVDDTMGVRWMVQQGPHAG